MNYIDYIILAFILIGFILGFKDGIIRKIVGLAGLIFAIFIGIKFYEEFGAVIAPVFNDEIILANIFAWIIIFLAVVLLTAIIKRVIHPRDKVANFINQILGAAVGIIQMLFFLSAILIFLNFFNFPDNPEKEKSIFYSSVYNVIPITMDLVLGDDSNIKDQLQEYFNNEETLPFSSQIDPI